MPRTRLFRAGCYLAVLANSDDQGDNANDKFWICCTKTDVYLENDFISVVWLEKVKRLKVNYITINPDLLYLKGQN